MEELVAAHPHAYWRVTLQALNQASRELLLAQSSDWAFMIASGTMREYATRRTKTHLKRLLQLGQQIESGIIDKGRATEDRGPKTISLPGWQPRRPLPVKEKSRGKRWRPPAGAGSG